MYCIDSSDLPSCLPAWTRCPPLGSRLAAWPSSRAHYRHIIELVASSFSKQRGQILNLRTIKTQNPALHPNIHKQSDVKYSGAASDLRAAAVPFSGWTWLAVSRLSKHCALHTKQDIGLFPPGEFTSSKPCPHPPPS